MKQKETIKVKMASFEAMEGKVFEVGQIVAISYNIPGPFYKNPNKFMVPAIITKVHKQDINGMNPCSFIIPVKGSHCEFTSWLTEKKRYLGRFISLRANIKKEFSWFLKEIKEMDSRIPESKNFPKRAQHLKLEDLFYIEDNTIIYPFRFEELESEKSENLEDLLNAESKDVDSGDTIESLSQSKNLMDHIPFKTTNE